MESDCMGAPCFFPKRKGGGTVPDRQRGKKGGAAKFRRASLGAFVTEYRCRHTCGITSA